MIKKSYMISNWAMDVCRKVRAKELCSNEINEALNDYQKHDYIFIHEDGKCVYDGLVSDFKRHISI